jgi:hypothetical protein
VFEGGLQPGYVLDNMPFYEINTAFEGIYLKNKAAWEQTRMICYVIAQANSTKRIKVSDIMEFPWDREGKNKENTCVSDEDAKRLNEKMNEYIKGYA